MTECPHGTYYPIEPCNPCALAEGKIKPLPRRREAVRTMRPAKYAGKCAGCGDDFPAGELVGFRDRRPHCESCLEEVPA